MKNFDSLERDLQALAAGGSAAPDRDELQNLSEMLRSASAERQRSSQHQEWAWTRCSARMQETPAAPSLYSLFQNNLRWLSTGVAAGLVSVLGFQYFNDLGTGPLPKVTSNSENISAVPFHSPKANADVIWVSGYNYLPASHTIR